MAYTDLTATFFYKKVLLSRELSALAENDADLKLNGWEDSTKAIFFQASAPTGWTKVTTNNGHMLRVVGSGNGGGVVAGTQGISTQITLAHTHTISTENAHTHTSSHNHTVGQTSHHIASSGTVFFGNLVRVVSGDVTRHASGGSSFSDALKITTTSTSPSITSSGSHNHGGTTGSQLTNITLAYIDSIICSKDTSSGYFDKTATFNAGDDLGDESTYQDFDDMAGSDAYLQARLTPTSSVSLFWQAASSVGWTKVTTQDDKAVRVVSGSGGGAGGSQALSTTISLAHNTHSMTSQGQNLHDIGAHTHALDTGTTSGAASDNGHKYCVNGDGFIEEVVLGGAVSKNFINGQTTSTTPGNTNTDANHIHTLGSPLSDVSLAYVNVIQCSKDGTGAEPFVYQDLTSFFSDTNLLAYQDLNDLGKNDAHIHYRTMPSASACLFFQTSAPTAWTRVTTHHDKAVRIVSGSGGSAGGSNVLSSGLTLAHTHTIQNYDHSHTYTHSHNNASTNSGNAATLGAGEFGLTNLGGFLYPLDMHGFGDSFLCMSNAYTSEGVTSVFSHSHGGATSSSLSNVTLAYLDVLLCSKN